MPIDGQWKDSGVEYYCYGEVSLPEVQEADQGVMNDARFNTLKYIFINALDITHVNMTDVEIQLDVAADFAHSFDNENLYLAFIVEKPEIKAIAESYVALYQKKHFQWQVAIFPTLAHAYDWIND